MAEHVESSYLRTLYIQTKTLLYKNYLLSLRNRRATFLQTMTSFFFVVLVFGVDKAIQVARSDNTDYKNLHHPEPYDIDHIPRCSNRGNNDYCLTFVYAPDDDPIINEIVYNLRTENDPEIPESEVRGFADAEAIDDFLYDNFEVATGGIIFEVVTEKSIEYTLQVNSTTKYSRGGFADPNTAWLIPTQWAVEKQILKYFTSQADLDELTYELRLKEFPHPAFDSWSVVGTIGPLFFLAAMMFGFVIQVEALVSEKESRIRQGMQTMGLLDSAFWISWFAWQFIMSFISAMCLSIFGLIFQFDLFLKNAFGLYFVLFFLFLLSMTSLAFAISTLLAKAATATVTGFGIYLISFILQLLVAFNFPFTCDFGEGPRILFSLFPPTLLAKGMKDLGVYTETPEDDGLRWDDRNTYCVNEPTAKSQCCLWGLDTIYSWLIAHTIVWLVLAIYMDNVVPDAAGVRKPYYYFLTRAYWSSAHNPPQSKTETIEIKVDRQGEQDDDVAEEELKVRSRLANASKEDNVAIELRGLWKTFPAGGRSLFQCLTCKPGPQDFQAVKGTWLRIYNGELFCLLGPNGAGKTTTVNCLTGVVPITKGDCVVLGEGLVEGGLERVRHRMGVCPQFDILWPYLSGYEHLKIFALIKGIHIDHIEQEVQRRLQEVALETFADHESRAYSGGMKRRLSVAIALIGDPEVIYLDEPTTGMDPISRRQVWDIIEAAKPGKAIILTTHSMEEADVLGDRIGIMAKGRLRCLGTSLRLKAKFGAGYHLTVALNTRDAVTNEVLDDTAIEKHANSVKTFFEAQLGLMPVSEVLPFLYYTIPRASTDNLSQFFFTLAERKAELGLSDLQLSLATLEDVFLHIATAAEMEEGRIVDYTLDDGTKIKIPVGAKLFEVGPGYTIEVKWIQDEQGNLQVGDAVRVQE